MLQGEAALDAVPDDAALADDCVLPDNGSFAVGITVYAQSVVVWLCRRSVGVS